MKILLRTAWEIQDDLSWQHRAYLASGHRAVEYSANDLATKAPTPPNLELKLHVLTVWRPLEIAKVAGDTSAMELLNKHMIQREQRTIAKQAYNDMNALNPLVVGVFGWMAVPPIPDAVGFYDHSIGYGRAIPDIGNDEHRIAWLSTDATSVWNCGMALGHQTRLQLCQKKLVDRARGEVDRILVRLLGANTPLLGLAKAVLAPSIY
jgi:hypothetical protein